MSTGFGGRGFGGYGGYGRGKYNISIHYFYGAFKVLLKKNKENRQLRESVLFILNGKNLPF